MITVDAAHATYPLIDTSLLGSVSESITVIRTSNADLFGLYRKVTGRKEVPFSGLANERVTPGIRQLLARFLRGNFFLPDARRSWNRYAFKKAKEIIKQESISTVITTSPPHSTQLIGLQLKKKFKLNWIADLRDPWTDIYYYDRMYPTALARLIDKKFEKSVLETADTVITVSKGVKQLFLQKSTKLDPSKFKIIPNGFDPEDFEGLESDKSKKSFTILYAGTLTDQYPLKGFLNALEASSFSKKVTLKFIGRQDQSSRQLLEIFSKSLDIQLVGYIPKAKLNQELVNCDATLMIIPEIANNKGILTGKLFDYLGAGKSILCIGPVDGDAAEIINDTSAGVVFPYSNFDRLNEALSILFSKGTFPADSLKIQNYSRRIQAQEISKFL